MLFSGRLITLIAVEAYLSAHEEPLGRDEKTCCAVNETALWYWPAPSLGGLERFHEYKYLIPKHALKRGISYVGEAARLRRAVALLLEPEEGQHFRVGVVGGRCVACQMRGIADALAVRCARRARHALQPA